MGTPNSNQNDRYKLMNNHDELNRQGNQINNIKAVGLETVDILRAANQDQYQQRDGLKRIAQTNNRIAFDIEKADKLTTQILRAELRKKALMFCIIGLLGVAIILIFFIKIMR